MAHRYHVLPILAALLYCCPFLQAQEWSKDDSIKLNNILSGKDSIRLNPEFQRAIKNGTLINTKPADKMLSAKSKIPFTKDFSEYIKLDESVVYENYNKFEKIPSRAALRDPVVLKESRYKINKRFYEIPGAITSGAQTPSGIDFNHLLSYALSAEYRQHIKNLKRLEKLKIYNDIPALKLYKKQKAYREAHPEMILRNDSLQISKKTNDCSHSTTDES